MLAIDCSLSMASFLKIRPTSFLKIALSSSNINRTMGASVWKCVKYGSNKPAPNEKKCNFAGRIRVAFNKLLVGLNLRASGPA